MQFAGNLLKVALALTCSSAMAVENSPQTVKLVPGAQGQTSERADNTNVNQRDKDNATKTPQDQSNRAQDRKLLAAVRRTVVSDKSLSTMAHNVKIVVENSTATLRGPVRTAEEKAKVEALAKKVKGITATDNQLGVKA